MRGKRKLTKTQKLSICGIAVATLLLVTTGIGVMLNRNKVKKLDPEIAKTMTYDQVKEGEEKTNSEFVQFDAFFLRDLDGDGYAEKVRGTCREVGEEDTLYMEFNVLTNGYLKEGKITVNSDKNYYLQTAIVKDNEIKQNYIGADTKEIELKELTNGTQKLLTATVRTGDYSYESRKTAAIGNDTSQYSKINSITFTGTHVQTNEDGSITEVPIEKTVNFQVDWHATTKTEIREIKEKEISREIDEEKKELNIEFTITTQERNNQLLLKQSYIEGVIPQLNEYDPSKVEVTGENISYTYDKNTRKFTATKEAILNNQVVTNTVNTEIDKTLRINRYQLKITYPLEAYETLGVDTFETKVPVKAYYEGYNNPSEEFQNPYRSNVAEYTYIIPFRNPEGDVAIFNVWVGRHVFTPQNRYIVSKHKPLKIYKGVSNEEKEDFYTVEWIGYTGKQENQGNMIMKETHGEGSKIADHFIKADSSEVSMEEVTSFVGIYFSDPSRLLGKEGEIKVYDDETGNLLATFNKDNWYQYNDSYPYQYETPVKHVRVETSDVNTSSSLSVYHVKELDDSKITDNYTEEEFKNLKYIKATLTGYIGENDINTDIRTAEYEEPISVSTVKLNQDAISTQETQKNFEIQIETEANEKINQMKWVNGAFLLKLPKDIIELDINHVQVNNPEVMITSYEQYEENGEKFIKINTSNENGAAYIIMINCDITADPRISTTTENIELYASNENNPNYYDIAKDIYDVNDNLNTEENVGKSEVALTLTAPNSLLTTQMASHYDANGSITVAPQVATVSKDQRKATITLQMNNNYFNSVSEMKILGKIPTAGNTYTINGNDMGSNFTTTMSKEGIVLPEELQGKAKIYYSNKENPSKEIADVNNEWTMTPENFAEVKSYLIDLENTIIATNEKYEISYEVNLPEGLNYNQVSYSHHAVYFSLDTAEGKYRTQTEPNKLGLRIAKQYDLELIKYQSDTTKTVPGATYRIQEEGEEESKTKVTGINGSVTLKNLYTDKIYTVKEIKSPSEYELNEDEIKFIAKEENGQIKVEKISGNAKSIVAMQNTEEAGYKVRIEVEDKVKANLRIVKTEKGTENRLRNVTYKITGKGLQETGRMLTTNTNGEISMQGLSIGEEYILEEIKADGYYLTTTEFKIVNTNGAYDIEILRGEAKETSVTVEDEIPTATIALENEKIPTYDVTITKVKVDDETNKGLEGARYSITSEDTKETKYYTTDNNGNIHITGLYHYVSGKYITGNYTIKELRAPDGYAMTGEEVTFKVTLANGTSAMSIPNEANLESVKSYRITGTTVNLILQDNPTFSIKKIDKETKEVLPGAKFIIQKVDTAQTVLGYAKDVEGNYVGERNSKGQYIITTDENGEFTAPLQGGFYKITEVEAPKGYELPSEENSMQYFTIEGYEDLKINYIEDLLDFANKVDAGTNYSGKVIGLGRNLDFEDESCYKNPNDTTTYQDYNGDGITQSIKEELTNKTGTGFKGIGKKNQKNFTGTFLGNDYEIRNIYMNSNISDDADYIGLFYNTASTAKISNLGITGEIKYENTDNTNTMSVGGIVGRDNQGTISNCYSKMNITVNTMRTNVGGIVAYNYGEIVNCYHEGTINVTNTKEDAYSYIGGIIGNAYKDGLVTGCYNAGSITVNGGAEVGGIVGNGSSSTIEKSYNTGKITVTGKNKNHRDIEVGGIIGYTQRSKISNCYNEGEILTDATDYLGWGNTTGGIVGFTGTGSVIENCSNKAIIIAKGGHVNLGGIVGGVSGEVTIQNCYNTKKLSGISKDTSAYVGGIAAEVFTNNSTINAIITECYNIGEVYGSSECKVNSSLVQIGGITGNAANYLTITNCYNEGKISGDGIRTEVRCAGIAGWLNESSKICNSYNTGVISSNSEICIRNGGIIGGSAGRIENTYNVGQVSGTASGDALIAGIAGYITESASVSNSYYMSGTASVGIGIDYTGINPATLKTTDYMESNEFLNELNSNKNAITTTPAPLTWVKGTKYPVMNINITIDTSTTVIEEEIIKPVTKIEIENTKKTYEITTEIGVNSSGLRSGGAITGTDISSSNHKLVETVKYKDNAQTEIEITPNTNYVISKVTLDGKEIEFTIDENGKVNLPPLENITENHHYVVIFENDIGSILVHHYVAGTENTDTPILVAPDESKTGKVGENYTTAPCTDIERYELIKSQEGEYIIPDNATGNYQKERQVITYLYTKKEIPLTIHHYIIGTNENVPLKDGTVAQDVTTKGQEGEAYTTTSVEEQLNPKYELVEVPANSTGTLEYSEVMVIYYYRIKKVNITTKVEGKGGTITGENETPYETVEYGEDSQKEIKAIPEEDYIVSSITVNGEEIEFTPNEDGSVELEKFIEMTEDKEVVVSFEKIPANVIVHHYMEGTETKVPSKTGGEVEDVQKEGKIKDIYVTKPSEEVANNYELVATPENASGEMTKETIVVTYYYRLINAEITSSVTKEGTNKITEETAPVSYQLSYTATIDKYIGKAEVILVDTFPFEIDQDKSDLQGGNYNQEHKTITWKESIENIDTFTDGIKSINLEKEISVVYKTIDTSKTSFENKVEGTIKLETTNQEEKTDPATKETETEFTKDVTVTKTWNHTNNIYEIPTRVIMQVKNGETVVAEQEVTEEENWTHTFTGLPKYDAEGTEIHYQVGEKEASEGELRYYEAEINNTTITNNYVGPVVTAKKEMTTANGLSYVVKGETITYTITVENEGKLETNVVVKDNIPEGTTFVEGSIKLNGTQSTTNTEEDLKQGLIINVPKATEGKVGTTTISFDVTVDDLEDGQIIRNTASINKKFEEPENPDEPTNEVTIKYVEPIITQEKTMTTANGLNYVVEGEEITYTIRVENAGGLAKEVVVKDTIPEGTTFVEGSIKVNGTESTSSAEDLKNGIKVNVPGKVGEENGKASISFKVKVNLLPEGTLEKEILNTAMVDETNTNTTTTNVNKPQVNIKKVSNPESGSTVKEGDKIAYTVEVKNTGTAPTEVTIKDSIPVGTNYVEDSLMINRSMLRANTHYTIEELTNGITLNLLAQEKVSITFEVTVNDLEDGTQIRNVANVNGEETNETVHNYVESIISQSKSAKTENGLDYVVEGEKITYTVQLNNAGGLAKEVVVKDTIPEGTSFVEGSIRVNGTATTNTEEELNSGITVNVPVAEDGLPGYASVSFDVTVNKGATGDIKNTATVDDKSTNEVKTPIVTYEKVATTNTETDEVTVGDVITYKVRVHNTGTVEVRNITVKDIIPEGTKLVEIEDNGQRQQKEITWVIDEIAGGETKEVGFTVEVEYAKEEHTITNVATVDTKTTNETENPYKKPEPELTSKVEKTGIDKITSKDTTVYYEVKFKATVNDFVGKAKVTMVDTLPYAIDESESELDGGHYNAENRTITWEDEIENIHTFNAQEAKEIAITKVIEVSYLYGNLDNNTGSMLNSVHSKIELQEPKAEDPTAYETVKEEEKDAEKETIIEIPTQVIVHHYFYDAETKLPTTVKLTNDDNLTGIVGQEYTTTPSREVTANYTCMSATPENYEGKMTEDIIEVIYYYSLTTPSVTNTIEKTATANKVVDEVITNEETGEETTVEYPLLTKENGEVVYNINYNAVVENYIGKVTVEVVDTLPAKIDTEKSDLNDGTYNETTRTITWNVDLENINTYANGVYKVDFAKQVKLVYVDQNVNSDLRNTVTGTTKVYYPEEHPTKGGKEQIEETATDESTVKQDYKVNLEVVKVWEDNNNLKEKRPESVKITVKEMLLGEVKTQVLSEENNWSYTVQNLPKYDKNTGRKLTYVVEENEVNKGDLEYYEPPKITQTEKTNVGAIINRPDSEATTPTETQTTTYKYTVKNSYKLLDTDLNTQITKNGTEEITASKQTVDYTIHFTAEIANYIGNGKVTMVDTLPYEIDERKSNLNGGNYNAENNTITWEEELPHINTEVSKENYQVDITKQITVVYKDLGEKVENTRIDKLINVAKGKVELYETDEKDEKETTFDTKVNIPGKVIVRYVDKDTGKDIIVKVSNEEGQLVDGTYNYEINGKVGEDYRTEAKDIENYIYVESTNNETGIIKEQDQEVIYYYEKRPTQVIVKYQDKEGNPLVEDEIIDGKIDDPYTTTPKDIENYQLVIIPDNKEGTMEKDTITVIYVYEKIPAKVIVKHLEKDTEKVLAPEDAIDGHVADAYETQRKAIAGYKKAEPEPTNASGIMKIDKETNNTITVIYYYERIPSGIVTVKYVDADTKEEITYEDPKTQEEKTYRYEIKGYVGDKYDTEEKEIPYYNLVKIPSNKQGTLEESGDTVIYYYSKQKFNMEISKEITKVVMNGEEKKVNDGKLAKIEIVASKISTTELEITYSIKVRNTEELAGKGKVVEIIPRGYTVASSTPGYWTVNAEGNLETTVELKPGEEKIIEVVLRWNNSGDNFGEAQNTVKVIDTENEANYEETTLEDNTSTASIITSIKTGMNRNILMIITATTTLILVLIGIYGYELTNKKKK